MDNTAYRARLIPGFTNSWYVPKQESITEGEDGGSNDENIQGDGTTSEGDVTGTTTNNEDSET